MAHRLNERLLTPALALIAHGECVEVFFYTESGRLSYRLSGRGEDAGTVSLSLWTPQMTRIRSASYEDCRLDDATAARLMHVADEQEDAPRFRRVVPTATRATAPARARQQSGELQRAQEWLDGVRAARGLAGAR